MPYATLDDLVTRFGEKELLAIAGTGDTDERVIDAAKVNAALATAGNRIDSFVARQHALPLDPAPPILTDLACDLARYELRTIQSGRSTVTEEVRKRFEDALAMLEKIAKGIVVLPIPAPSPAPSAGRVVAASAGRIFTPEGALRGYRP